MLRLICLLLFATTAAVLLPARPAAAQCAGQNLLASMPAADRAALDAAADAVPYPRGNLWRATKGDAVLTLVGTYHLEDARHAATMATLAPLITTARTVLVEAGPQEEEALKAHMSRDPSLMFITTGPTLLEMMPKADWTALSAALELRGVPGILAAKLQPWYVSLLLAIPPCTLSQAQAERGLDALVIEAAAAARVPVRALEPYDTLFSLFDILTPEEQLAMIRSTLALDARAEDFATTLTEAYFLQENRLLWEFMRRQSYALPGYTPAQVDAEFARMEEALIAARNRNWLPVLTAAAADGPAFAAFGALHLPGRDGVLALLERDGFAVERLAFP